MRRHSVVVFVSRKDERSISRDVGDGWWAGGQLIYMFVVVGRWEGSKYTCSWWVIGWEGSRQSSHYLIGESPPVVLMGRTMLK